MPSVEMQTFFQDLQKGDLNPVYFLHGEEPYLISQGLDYIRKTIIDESMADFNLSTFYASDAEVEKVRDEVETLPMMSEKRLVFLKEVHDLKDKEWQQLWSVIEKPVDSTVFVLSATKIDKRKKIFKELLDQACAVEFKRPFENQIPAWIKHIAKENNLEMSSAAIHRLHHLVGNNLSDIQSEILKISTYLGERNYVELEDVNAVVSRAKEENIFDLTNAIGEGNRVKALEHLVHLLDQGQSEVGIVSMVARHVRIMLTIKKGQQNGLQGQKLAQFAQVSPYFLDSYLKQTRHWSQKKIEDFILVLSETDKALKSSPVSAHIWLENMILKICTE